MTKVRSAIVSNRSYTYLSIKKLQLQEFIIHRIPNWTETTARVVDVVNRVKDARFLEFGDLTDSSKVFSDCFEAVAGAVFVDSGFQWRVVEKVFQPILVHMLEMVNQVEQFLNVDLKTNN